MEDYLIKSNAETNPEYGCNPYERPIEEHIAKGIINLDKPSGPTSHEVDSWVKRILAPSSREGICMSHDAAQRYARGSSKTNIR